MPLVALLICRERICRLADFEKDGRGQQPLSAQPSDQHTVSLYIRNEEIAEEYAQTAP